MMNYNYANIAIIVLKVLGYGSRKNHEALGTSVRIPTNYFGEVLLLLQLLLQEQLHTKHLHPVFTWRCKNKISCQKLSRSSL